MQRVFLLVLLWMSGQIFVKAFLWVLDIFEVLFTFSRFIGNLLPFSFFEIYLLAFSSGVSQCNTIRGWPTFLARNVGLTPVERKGESGNGFRV